MNIGIIAKIKVKKEFLSEVYLELKTLHELTHKLDKGFTQYDLTQDIEDEQVFIFVEVWGSQEALSLHEKKEHFLTFLENIENKLEDIQINKTIKKL